MPTLCIFSIALFRINCYNIFNTLSVCILRKKMIHMLIFLLWILISCIILLIMKTNYLTSYFIFLFAGIGFLGSCIEDIWEWRKKPKIHLSSFDKFMKIGHFILCPLDFLAFFVQHYK